MLYALYRVGYHSKMTMHGFRALFPPLPTKPDSTRMLLSANLLIKKKMLSGRHTIGRRICRKESR